jgi:DNA phosphorothioation-dependent restriction protein DptG
MTVVAQKADAPGIHCYVAGSIPAVTPRYCRKKIEKCSLERKKRKRKKTFQNPHEKLNRAFLIKKVAQMSRKLENIKYVRPIWRTFQHSSPPPPPPTYYIFSPASIGPILLGL